MAKILCRLCFPILLLFIFVAVCPIHADTSSLITTLTDQLGVTQKQATGGAGAIFKYAKSKLSPDDFSTVAKALPGTDALISAAPKTSTSSNLLSGLKSVTGEQSKSTAAMSSLAGSFSQLGMKPDMAGKFIPIILEYSQSKGGTAVMTLLKGVLL
jgi:hypothetical protein